MLFSKIPGTERTDEDLVDGVGGLEEGDFAMFDRGSRMLKANVTTSSFGTAPYLRCNIYIIVAAMHPYMIEFYSYIHKMRILSSFGQRQNSDIGARVHHSHRTV